MNSIPAALTAFQVSVASLFFSLPASEGFLLAGGAALAAQNLTSRPTHDLDLFTRAGASSVPAARDAFEAAARDRGWSVERLRDAEIPIDGQRAAQLRSFFEQWRRELRAGSS